MKYKIKITYSTGDSFRSQSGLEQYLDGHWKDEDKAVENAERIEAHYKNYQAIHNPYCLRFGENAGKIIKEAKKAKWYVEQYPTDSIKLITDEGIEYQQSTFWTGYFESLDQVDVEIEKPYSKSF